MIREAAPDDIPQLVAMGLRFIRESGYPIEASPAALTRLMDWLIGSDEGAVFVIGKQPVGMIGAHVFTHPVSGERCAAEVFWWVDPEHRGSGLDLLDAAEDWARRKGARKMQMVAPDDRTGLVYRRHGYARLEEHFQKEL